MKFSKNEKGVENSKNFQKKVLVVEDNEKNMYLMRFILTKKGYKVIEARTGEKGIEMTKKEKPDLIIMDIKLPDIDGLEVTKRIRKIKGFEKTPIIAVTSYAMTGDKEKALKAGCTGYIKKPIDPDTFIENMEKGFEKFI